MNPAHVFRRSLAHRLFALLALPAAGAVVSGCFIGTSCPDNDEPIAAERCFTWPPEDAGAGGGGGGSVDPLVCPSRDEAVTRLNDQFFASHTVKSDGTLKNGQCCYATEFIPYCEGRPYLVGEVARTAPAIRGRGDGGWGAQASSGPDVSAIEPDLRAALAAEWTRDALFEHASVASFGRFALELLAVGAPAELVEEAHRAALDEVRHARLCFALASAYAGEPVAPGAFPFGGAAEVVADLASIAARTAKEGCINETIAAVIAAEQCARAEDPAVAEVLAGIAADEARHAELAWRTVAWAIRVGGERVRAAVEEVFVGLGQGAVLDAGGAEDPRLAAHGRLAGAALSEATARALEEVVGPAAGVLFQSVAPGFHPGPEQGLSAPAPGPAQALDS
ncbi:ferritin-like domain-containing protein [Polyangium jinanense]|uniref:Ferritin-like domain-containing protein n=1 Tax=Polyangium jinanense TaxID=2829994 RepID=A0A9X3X9N2_9BACT|nr:ferritin-like domain-containing protein [Polyangium jinanense]MDC3958704.1 ferritin-like domain-containing protein [Polyangium jinanense]MDC3985315.1 ferritin-like domain-containing protein [Polyangium jinanense]